jgi:hypothetical protein
MGSINWRGTTDMDRIGRNGTRGRGDSDMDNIGEGSKTGIAALMRGVNTDMDSFDFRGNTGMESIHMRVIMIGTVLTGRETTALLGEVLNGIELSEEKLPI